MRSFLSLSVSNHLLMKPKMYVNKSIFNCVPLLKLESEYATLIAVESICFFKSSGCPTKNRERVPVPTPCAPGLVRGPKKNQDEADTGTFSVAAIDYDQCAVDRSVLHIGSKNRSVDPWIILSCWKTLLSLERAVWWRV
jgi:hypothetical protein